MRIIFRYSLLATSKLVIQEFLNCNTVGGRQGGTQHKGQQPMGLLFGLHGR